MLTDRKSLYRILLFLLWYFGGGFLAWRFLSDPPGLTDSFFYASALAAWILSMREKVADPPIRRSLTEIGALLLGWILLRAAGNGCFPASEPIRLLIRLLYAVPLTGVPLLSFRLSLRLGSKDPLPRRWDLLFLPWILLIFGILTEGLHGLAFQASRGDLPGEFPGNMPGEMPGNMPSDLPGDMLRGSSVVRGPLYAAAVVWAAVLLSAALIAAAQRTPLPNSRRSIWLPVLPPALSAAYLGLLLFTDLGPALPYQLPEIFCFLTVGFWECCIRIGLIPSGVDYEDLFQRSHLSARITDDAGQTVWAASSSLPLKTPNENNVLNNRRITGGQMIWTENTAEINRLRKELHEANLRLADETDLLTAENLLKKEQAQFAEQNRIYSAINASVSRQTAEIAALVKEAEAFPDRFAADMTKASLLTAYIKRKANLTLHAHGSETLALGELLMSLNESTDYLTRCGVPSFCRNDRRNDSRNDSRNDRRNDCRNDRRTVETAEAELSLPAEWILSAYDAFESAMEAGLPSLTGLIVRVSASVGDGETADGASLTLLLSADTPAAVPASFPGDPDVSSEEEDGTVRLTLRWHSPAKEGGGRT